MKQSLFHFLMLLKSQLTAFPLVYKKSIKNCTNFCYIKKALTNKSKIGHLPEIRNNKMNDERKKKFFKKKRTINTLINSSGSEIDFIYIYMILVFPKYIQTPIQPQIHHRVVTMVQEAAQPGHHQHLVKVQHPPGPRVHLVLPIPVLVAILVSFKLKTNNTNTLFSPLSLSLFYSIAFLKLKHCTY